MLKQPATRRVHSKQPPPAASQWAAYSCICRRN